jgi:hypothetical protein
VAANHRVVLADDETVRIVSPALPGHVRVASPSGRPQLDDGAKRAAAHARRNNQLMKIIPDSGCLPPRVGGASSGTRPARHGQAAHPDRLVHPVAGVAAVGPVDAGGARRYVVIVLLAAGLGLQNATVRRLAVPDVTTTCSPHLARVGCRLLARRWPQPPSRAPPGRCRPLGRGDAGGSAAAVSGRGDSDHLFMAALRPSPRQPEE